MVMAALLQAELMHEAGPKHLAQMCALADDADLAVPYVRAEAT